MGVEIEQAVRATLTDGQEPACSISLYLVQIQISLLYVHVFQSLSSSLCFYICIQSVNHLKVT